MIFEKPKTPKMNNHLKNWNGRHDAFDFWQHECYHQNMIPNTKVPSKFVMSIKSTPSINSGNNRRRDLLHHNILS